MNRRNIAHFFVLLLVILFFSVSSQLIFGSEPDIFSWPVYTGNEGHTGFSLGSAPSTNQTFWIYNGTVGYPSVPVADNLNVYVGAVNGRVDALNATTGALIWSFQTQPDQYFEHAPYVATGHNLVFVCPWTETTVYALDASKGKIVWTFDAGYRVGEKAPVFSDGTLYICSIADLIALDASNGTLLWTYPQPNGDTSFSLAVSNGRLFVGHTSIEEQGKFLALNSTTGEQLWSITLGKVSASPSAVDGKVFVHVEDGKLYALNETNGNMIWNFSPELTQPFSSGTPAIAYGKVFFAPTQTSTVYAFDEANGSLLWKVNPSPFDATKNYGSLAVGEQKIFVGIGQRLVALDATSGITRWTYFLGNSSDNPALAYGIVFIGSGNSFYAFGSEIAVSEFSEVITPVLLGIAVVFLTVLIWNRKTKRECSKQL